MLFIVKCTVGKLINGVISFISVSISNVFLKKRTVLCPISVFTFRGGDWVGYPTY